MLYASGSGLDPHISVDAALLQVNRVAEARQMSDAQKSILVQHIQQSAIYNLGKTDEKGVINVLMLNMELDNLSSIR